MKTKVTLVLAALMMSMHWGLAQGNNSSGANTRLQDTRRWQKDIDKYNDVLEKGEFPAVMEKLADAYRMTGNLEDAEDWYRKSIVSGNQNSTCRLNYAKVLQSNGKYQEAKGQFKLYEEVTGEYEVGEKFIASCDLAMQVRDEKGRYQIRPVSELNTKHSDMVSINDRFDIVFATRGSKREIGTGKVSKKGPGDYDLYTAIKQGKGFLDKVKRVKGKANSRKYDDVSAVQMPGSDLVLFTRIGEANNASASASAARKVKISGARIRGRKWYEIEKMPYNFKDGNANFQPAIHPSGDLIIFASDRPGGYGGVDLYMVQRMGAKWSEPQNLGPDVNTEGDELFPSFNEQGFLFFASDGHVGYGGLDIYTADFKNRKYTNPQNMGTGINSSKDDFGVIWDPKASGGYFTSNRNLESGDDIYYFNRLPGISGQVFDGMTKEPLAGSIIRLRDVSGNERIVITDGAGRFSEPCKTNTGYQLVADAPGFYTYRDTLWTRNMPQGRDLNVNVYLKAEQMYELSGRVIDAVTDSSLIGATIKVMSNGKNVANHPTTRDSADFEFKLTANEDYTVIFEQPGYIPRIKNLAIGNIRGVLERETLVPMITGDYVLLHGRVKEADSEGKPGKVLSKTRIGIINNNTNEIVDSTMTLRDGSFWVAVPLDSMSNYSVISAREGYYAHSVDIEADSLTSGQEIEMELVLNEARFGLDYNVKVVRYDYNQAKLDLLSRKDLNEIFFFLLENPNAKLEVRSHTDSRGTKDYNLELSRRRSESVIEYIRTRRPIPEDRFVSWGFGEAYPLNQCIDGVNCDEESHAVNRRTEIKAVER